MPDQTGKTASAIIAGVAILFMLSVCGGLVAILVYYPVVLYSTLGVVTVISLLLIFKCRDGECRRKLFLSVQIMAGGLWEAAILIGKDLLFIDKPPSESDNRE